MFVTLITDCCDDNAFGRQTTRLGSFFNCAISTVGVKNDLEAAGNLIDMLDVTEEDEGVILVNVAPRHKEAKKWPNGTPFGYFFVGKTLVISSIDGLTLSITKKLGIGKNINLLDIPTVLNSVKEQGLITEKLVDHITHTQFRSLEFVPRVAKWLIEGVNIPSQEYSLDNAKAVPDAVWWVDNFGNCKTTLFAGDLELIAGKRIKLNIGEFEYFERLKDVPDHEGGVIVGSSGFKESRFLEIVVQGKSAAEIFNIQSGTQIAILP